MTIQDQIKIHPSLSLAQATTCQRENVEQKSKQTIYPLYHQNSMLSLYINFFVYSAAFTSTDHNPEENSHAIELCKNAWCSHQTEVSNASYGRAADPNPFLLEEPRTGDPGGLKTR